MDPETQTGPSPATEAKPAEPRRSSLLTLGLPLLAIVGALALVTLLIVGHSSSPALPSGAHSESSAHFAGEALTPRLPAPGLGSLHNYAGGKVDLASYRGKAVLVTFLYAHCPDVCPLMTAELHNALARMTPAERREVQIIAVSVDPRRDTREAVAEFVAAHGMTGKMKYLVGDAHELAPVWEAWNVGSEKDSVNPEFVAHSALIYGVSGSGKLTTIYPSNFKPQQIVADVPKLAHG